MIRNGPEVAEGVQDCSRVVTKGRSEVGGYSERNGHFKEHNTKRNVGRIGCRSGSTSKKRGGRDQRLRLGDSLSS